MANIESLSASWILIMLTYVSISAELESNSSDDAFTMDDMIIPRDLFLSAKVGTRYRWPNAIVPVEIDTNFNSKERAKIMKDLALITQKTCVRFPVRTKEHDYIRMVRAGRSVGCNSKVGRQGGMQILNLEPSSKFSKKTCIKPGIIAHETIHALGFFHEHARHDRDDHIKINVSNIEKGAIHNFDKLKLSETFNVRYDFRSIMHYSAKAFAINKAINTINTIPPNQAIGQRIELSKRDAEKLNKMYRCSANGGKCIVANTDVIVALIVTAAAIFVSYFWLF